jgi:pyruvate ferredoxin oxidoreductase gamma subunit
VVLDASLLWQAEAGVLDGVDAATLLLVNSTHPAGELRARLGTPARVVAFDVSSIALGMLGHPLLSAPAAGLTVKATGLVPWELLADAVRVELAEAGLGPDLIERNLRATRRAFDGAPVVGLQSRPPANAGTTEMPFVVPHVPARVAAPSMTAVATSALRTTEGWRVWRPVIDLARCTRCFLCFALCPEGAIRLDAESYPVIDHDHCKGCLVCVAECPPRAIAEVREPDA